MTRRCGVVLRIELSGDVEISGVAVAEQFTAFGDVLAAIAQEVGVLAFGTQRRTHDHADLASYLDETARMGGTVVLTPRVEPKR